MADTQLVLTDEERDLLAEQLQTVLHDTRIEEHRTRTLSYRPIVVHREELLASILTKLGRTPEAEGISGKASAK
jgi:hypothetical protein